MFSAKDPTLELDVKPTDLNFQASCWATSARTASETVSDPAQVNAQIARVVTASNCLKDVNASGTLTVADKGIANTQITRAPPAP